MKAFLKQLTIQIRMDARDKGTFLVFYIVPLVFYGVMGAVFSSINPQMKQTLSATMAIFSVTMGAMLGLPPTLVKLREANVLRAYRINGIPGTSVLLSVGISALLHLSVVSLLISFSAPIFFGAKMPPHAGGFAAALIMLLLCNVSLGLLIGVFAKNQAAAVMFSQAVFLPSVMLSGMMFPASMLPEPLMYLGRILPATHATQAFSGLAYELAPDFSAPLALLIMLGIGLAAAAATAWRFGKITQVS